MKDKIGYLDLLKDISVSLTLLILWSVSLILWSISDIFYDAGVGNEFDTLLGFSIAINVFVSTVGMYSMKHGINLELEKCRKEEEEVSV